MHPHSVHSYEHPMEGADNSQWNFHLPDTQHCPAKSFHFLDRTGRCVEHWQQTNTQADDRQLVHHLYPTNRHKPFPSYLCNRSPLYPLQASFPQSVSNLMVCYHQRFWKEEKLLFVCLCFCVTISLRRRFVIFGAPTPIFRLWLIVLPLCLAAELSSFSEKKHC